MLNYEEFKQRVLDEFLDYMPEEYKNCELQVREVPKVNQTLTGVVLVPKDKPKAYVSPTFYMERMYDQYLECGSFEETMENQAGYLEESMKVLPKDAMTLDWDSIKTKIIFQVVNTEKNQSMIDNCPHRDIMDLSVVYRAIISTDEHGVSGFLITNDIARAENFTEEELYNLAKENTRNVFPPTVERIEATMMRMMKRWGAPEEEIESMFPGLDEVPPQDRCFVISNAHEFFGANNLLYTDVLDKAAEEIGTPIYVLPSSVHDLVVVSSESFASKEKLSALVSETNRDHVKESEVLSNSVYAYNPLTKELNPVDVEVELDNGIDV